MDFKKAEEVAFYDSYMAMNFEKEYSQELLTAYSNCNIKWWKRHELGRCTKKELTYGRFFDFMSENNLTGEPAKMQSLYQENLSKNNFLINGALDMLEELSKTHIIYIITNGISITQHGRIDNSPMFKYIHGLFISEEIHHAKPDVKFFDYVFEKGNIKNKSDCLVIGDSLSSDIQGANNYGLDCLWFNHENSKNETNLKFHEVKTIDEIMNYITNN